MSFVHPTARPISEIPADQISVQESVVIGNAGTRDLTGDLYVPPPEDDLRPAIVVLHGGGWWKGASRSVRGFGELLSRAGFVCLCVSYRLSGESQWPAQIEDVKCSVRYLKACHQELGVDPDRIGVTGDSAGGHLALMAAVPSDFDGVGGHQAHSSEVKAVGAMYSPTQLRRQQSNAASTRLLGPNAGDDDYRRASPICYDLTNFPPCLLIHGSEDPGVPLTQTTAFYEKLSQLGRSVELHIFSGEGHAFDRQSTTKDGMVDVADPSSVYGTTVVGLIALFFAKYLSKDPRA